MTGSMSTLGEWGCIRVGVRWAPGRIWGRQGSTAQLPHLPARGSHQAHPRFPLLLPISSPNTQASPWAARRQRQLLKGLLVPNHTRPLGSPQDRTGRLLP